MQCFLFEIRTQVVTKCFCTLTSYSSGIQAVLLQYSNTMNTQPLSRQYRGHPIRYCKFLVKHNPMILHTVATFSFFDLDVTLQPGSKNTSRTLPAIHSKAYLDDKICCIRYLYPGVCDRMKRVKDTSDFKFRYQRMSKNLASALVFILQGDNCIQVVLCSPLANYFILSW